MSLLRRIVRSSATKNIGVLVGMYSAAELTQQTTTQRYDISKISRVGTTCVLWNGPINHMWYKFLDGAFKGVTTRIVLTKTALDILVFTPVSIAGFYLGMSIVERQKNIFSEVRLKFWPTYSIGFAFWATAQAVNFHVVPPKYRVVYVSIVAFVWANIICHMKQKNEPLPSTT
ncbi:mpv17-like protein [Saccoglossus kowalevskii]|uniref:Mpv17-like protein-like n=1 Tax=Saccoglossus kowalevskii TaxID=10224 RepID=A0ABM0MXF1_SACKO|nr:PREDICTED: mpv17-like protein-like [Saccoglossus kowalevskii]